MLQNVTYNFAEFTRSVEPLKCFSIYAYLLSIGKTNSSAACHYLIMVPLSNYGNGKTNSSATSFNMKNHSTEKKLHNKKGSRAKKARCKKNRSEFAMKNVPCVHGTIEIALEQIQRNIAANLRRQKCRKFALCVS